MDLGGIRTPLGERKIWSWGLNIKDRKNSKNAFWDQRFQPYGVPPGQFSNFYHLFEILRYTAIWQICVGFFFFGRTYAQKCPILLYFGPFSKHLFLFSKHLPCANFFSRLGEIFEFLGLHAHFSVLGIFNLEAEKNASNFRGLEAYRGLNLEAKKTKNIC